MSLTFCACCDRPVDTSQEEMFERGGDWMCWRCAWHDIQLVEGQEEDHRLDDPRHGGGTMP